MNPVSAWVSQGEAVSVFDSFYYFFLVVTSPFSFSNIAPPLVACAFFLFSPTWIAELTAVLEIHVILALKFLDPYLAFRKPLEFCSHGISLYR